MPSWCCKIAYCVENPRIWCQKSKKYQVDSLSHLHPMPQLGSSGIEAGVVTGASFSVCLCVELGEKGQPRSLHLALT